ncbi:MAG: conjugal transfer protein TraN [Magnetococcales bacterium]|nr:conjugal transfer protein TraN [Magnetococcales bacterium]NGZ25391.1 conjugal transfer protein TraN [Magnetococcales bacterium]
MRRLTVFTATIYFIQQTMTVWLLAYADVMNDAAGGGQALGTSLLQGYRQPTVDGTGVVTLGNGTLLQPGELFPGGVAGSMDEPSAAFGSAGAMNTATVNTTSRLAGEQSWHGEAYRLMMGTSSVRPNLRNDPIFTVSDGVLSLQDSTIDGLFSGCEQNNGDSTWSVGTTTHLPRLETCDRVVRPPGCRVTRNVLAEPPVLSVSGIGTITSCGSNCWEILVGYQSLDQYTGASCTELKHETFTVEVKHPELIQSATVTTIAADDQMMLVMEDVKIAGSGTYTDAQNVTLPCSGTSPWSTNPNIDISNAFQTAGQLRFDVYVLHAPGTGRSGGYGKIRLSAPAFVEESLADQPLGCLGNLSWPPVGEAEPWNPTDSENDRASTAWWECTDAASSRVIGGVEITPEAYGNILQPLFPDAPTAPPAPICYAASLRVESGWGVPASMECWVDAAGYTQCPTVTPDSADTCTTYRDDPACAYLGETCVDGAVSPVTGQCYAWTVTYDCGYDADTRMGGGTDAAYEARCGAPVRGMGTDLRQGSVPESNQSFGESATWLSTLNMMAMDYGCDEGNGWGSGNGCRIFSGKARECKKAVAGVVNCCKKPDGIGIGNYITILTTTKSLADRTGLSQRLAASPLGQDVAGAWTDLQETASATWDTVTMPLTSAIEDLAYREASDICGWIPGSGPDSLWYSGDVSTFTRGLSQEMMNSVGEWMSEAFPETAQMIFSETGGEFAFSETIMAGYEQFMSFASPILTAYMVYQIAMLLISIIWECEQSEMELGAQRQMNLCHYVGSYCKSKFLGVCLEKRESYCCFNSPLARIVNEQGLRQLGRSWGGAEGPNCSGFLPGEIGTLDFSQMDLSEWYATLSLAGMVPPSVEDAASRLSLENITRSTRSTMPGGYPMNTREILDNTVMGQGINLDQIHDAVRESQR